VNAVSAGRFPFDPALLESLAARHRSAYASAVPFPHAVLDSFFPTDVAQRLLQEFPPPEAFAREEDSAGPWRRGKLYSRDVSSFGPQTVATLRALGSPAFLGFLSVLSGIDELVANPEIYDALRHFERGGRLGVHCDFNWHREMRLHRRLNLLVYLNREWPESWNGSLELWDAGVTRCVSRIAPLFNRAVVFTSTDTSFHGFPEPLACPPGVTRKSLQRYYYTRTRPASEASAPHGTLFQRRPQDSEAGSAGEDRR